MSNLLLPGCIWPVLAPSWPDPRPSLCPCRGPAGLPHDQQAPAPPVYGHKVLLRCLPFPPPLHQSILGIFLSGRRLLDPVQLNVHMSLAPVLPLCNAASWGGQFMHAGPSAARL